MPKQRHQFEIFQIFKLNKFLLIFQINRLAFECNNLRNASFCTIVTIKSNIKLGKSCIFLISMIIDFSEPRAPKEKSHPIFFCPLGSLETVYIVAMFQSLDYTW